MFGIKKMAQKQAPAKKEEPVKKELKIHIDDYGEDCACTMRIEASYLGNDKVVFEGLYIADTDISCGTQEISGITGIPNFIKRVPGVADDGIVDQVIEDFLKILVEDVKESRRAAFVLVSNNDGYPQLNDILDKICISKSGWRESPKTDNNIQIWVL